MSPTLGSSTPNPLERLPYHLGLATGALEEAMTRLTNTFGVTWTPIVNQRSGTGFATPTEVVDHWTVRKVHSEGMPLGFELMEGSPGSTWHTDELAVVHHVAYWSNDVGGEVDALVAAGWEIEVAYFDDDGRAQEFAYLRRSGEVRVELLDDRHRARHELLVGTSSRGYPGTLLPLDI